jgi:carbon storage regulator
MSRLVLTRKIGQTLFIGDDIEIKVIDKRGSQIKLMVIAPSSMEILREEAVDKLPKKD